MRSRIVAVSTLCVMLAYSVAPVFASAATLHRSSPRGQSVSASTYVMAHITLPNASKCLLSVRPHVAHYDRTVACHRGELLREEVRLAKNRGAKVQYIFRTQAYGNGKRSAHQTLYASVVELGHQRLQLVALASKVTMPRASHCVLISHPEIYGFDKVMPCHDGQIIRYLAKVPMSGSVHAPKYLLELIAAGSGKHPKIQTFIHSVSGESVVSVRRGNGDTRKRSRTSVSLPDNLSIPAKREFPLVAKVHPNPLGGTVSFSDSLKYMTGCAKVPVNRFGTATCLVYIGQDVVASDLVKASYSGDQSHFSSVKRATVGVVSSATAMSLDVAGGNLVAGKSFTVTAAIKPDPGSGYVAFSDTEGYVVGCGSVPVDPASGAASCQGAILSPGTPDTISAVYSGNLAFKSTTAPSIVVDSQQIHTVITVTTTSVSIDALQTVGLVATITPIPNAGVVDFANNGPSCDGVPVNPLTGKAICTGASFSNPGVWTVAAQYLGDSAYQAAFSTTQVTVGSIPTSLDISLPAHIAIGSPFVITANVTPVPDGQVTVSFGTPSPGGFSNLIEGCADIPLVNGQAQCSETDYQSEFSIVATTSGAGNYAGSTAQVTSLASVPTVLPPAESTSSTILSADEVTIQQGQVEPFAIETPCLGSPSSASTFTTSYLGTDKINWTNNSSGNSTGSGSVPAFVQANTGVGMIQLQIFAGDATDGIWDVEVTATCAGYPTESMTLQIVVVSNFTFAYPYNSLSTGYLSMPANANQISTISYAGDLQPADISALGNNMLGDCVIAADLHLAQLWYAEEGVNWQPTMADAMDMYNTIDYYSGPSYGTAVTTSFGYWNQESLGGMYIEDYEPLPPADWTSQTALAEAIQLTGGLLAINLYGDHMVTVDGVGNDGVEVITWGSQVTIPWSTWDSSGYIQDVFAVNPTLWDSLGHGPSGAPSSSIDAMFQYSDQLVGAG